MEITDGDLTELCGWVRAFDEVPSTGVDSSALPRKLQGVGELAFSVSRKPAIFSLTWRAALAQ
ncbi:MAG: hypothetical protein DI609_12195, partial [Corynebacterium urealyticum]